jgi:hypothetical protein
MFRTESVTALGADLWTREITACMLSGKAAELMQDERQLKQTFQQGLKL